MLTKIAALQHVTDTFQAHGQITKSDSLEEDNRHNTPSFPR